MSYLDAGRIVPAIEELLDRIEHETDEYGRLLETETMRELAYKSAYHKALLRSQAKSEDRRKAEASEVAHDLWSEYRMAAALTAAKREWLQTARAKLSALQSLNANVRSVAGG